MTRFWFVGMVLFALAQDLQASQREFFVSPSGSDQNPGTKDQPFLTLQHARDVVRQVNHDMHGNIVVYLSGGIYPIAKPVEFTPSDSGQNGFTVIYQALDGDIPIISGGVPVTGWTLDHDHVYKAVLNSDHKLRSLFVNGVRAEMTSMTVKGQGPWGEFVIKGNEPWAETAGKTMDGILFNSRDLPADLTNPADIEILQKRVFSFITIYARDAAGEGDQTVLKLQQPYGAIAATMAWHCGIDAKGNFTLRNVYEALKKPGEFYFNEVTHTLYYVSRGEDMRSATVIAPISEGLIRLTGASKTEHVHDIRFQGLTFAYDHWLLRQVGDSRGATGVQSLGLYTRFRNDGNHHKDHYDMLDLPQGTVELSNCDHIEFERNRFEHLSSATGVSLINDVVDSEVSGNVFEDDSGNAINVGHPQHYRIGATARFTADNAGVCANDIVKDNWIRTVCLEFKQEEAISGFFTQDLKILHNDIEGVPYGGIALGWGWGDSNLPPSTVPKNNIIAYNRLVNTQQVLSGDGGPIYVLGQQPGGEIRGNYVNARCGRLIYPDDGSAYWKLTDNMLAGSAWLNIWTGRCHDLTLDNNYTTSPEVNNHGTRCPVTNTHLETMPLSPAAQAIVDNSGLEPQYKDIVPRKND